MARADAGKRHERNEHGQGSEETTDTQGREPSPATNAAIAADDLLDGLGVPDQAYRLHLRGLGVRVIGQKLGIDKDTAQRYVRQVEREMAPRRKETREKLLRTAIVRLRGIALEASEQLDHMAADRERCNDGRAAAALLNTRLNCEREIARLQGLFEHLVSDDEGAGIVITISRRAPAGGPLSASGDGLEAGG